MAGGIVVPVPLDFKDGTCVLNMDTFTKALTEKTRILILNTLHNPTGTVFSRDTLQKIATVLLEFSNIVVLCDEVYEHLVYDNAPFTRSRNFQKWQIGVSFKCWENFFHYRVDDWVGHWSFSFNQWNVLVQ